MLFNSHEFLLGFLPVALAVYFLLGRGGLSRLAIPWLVLASLFFYGWWNPVYLLLILGSIGFNFTVGRYLARHAGRGPTGPRRLALALGVGVNLGALGWFKYADFLAANLGVLVDGGLPRLDIVLPLAISFFTFQQIAFLADAYQGLTREYNLVDYALFVTFFPQLIAGPIVHHSEVLPQFRRHSVYHPRLENLTVGGTFLVLGLFKKVVLADNLAHLANPVFAGAEQGASLIWSEAWTGVGAYTLQLYLDFSGYSDMAIGLARLFGIQLPLNFNSPYRAVNIVDFWRRWHITLSRFLRDYLYFPLGGNRKGRARRYLNLMITMVLGGLWHGAGWTFVAWGTLHGVYLVLNHFWHWIRPGRLHRWWSVATARIVTLLAVMLGWIFFRAETFPGALAVLRGFGNLPRPLAEVLGPWAATLEGLGLRFEAPSPGREDVWLLLASGAILLALWRLPNLQELLRDYRPALVDLSRAVTARAPHGAPLPLTWRPSVAWAILVGGAAAAVLLSLSRVSEFLYFQF